MLNNSEQKARSVSDNFLALSNYAEKLAFPDYREGIFASKDATEQNIILRYIYALSHPFTAKI
jgi:hypothetical protein